MVGKTKAYETLCKLVVRHHHNRLPLSFLTQFYRAIRDVRILTIINPQSRVIPDGLLFVCLYFIGTDSEGEYAQRIRHHTQLKPRLCISF